ncbi:MAG: Crp/Fnr family transcriptional regulator [Actinomycetota bacterium]|nr:Crp/Fnr family transcriptional regulator [Actinomycetota bacterium]
MVPIPQSPPCSLVDVDPDLVAGIPHDDLPLARRVLLRPRYELPKGRWAPGLLGAHEGAIGFLVVEGAIIREIDLGGRGCAQVLGPGDVLGEPTPGGVLDCPVTWTALLPSVLLVLDARFVAAAQRWPSLAANLHRRLLEQGDRAALHAATAQLPRVDRRLVALFWQLSDPWGHVTPFGIDVPLPLTHELLGRLVGAQRPTVSLALRELAGDGVVTRSARGGWLLAAGSQALLGSGELGRPVAVSASTGGSIA